MSISATTIANKAAVQKPSTSNLLPINLSLNKIIKMVMIKETNPKVSQFKGKVNSLKIPPTMALTKPITNPRSEEHTSELQSRENLVCRLLLEKKKKK